MAVGLEAALDKLDSVEDNDVQEPTVSPSTGMTSRRFRGTVATGSLLLVAVCGVVAFAIPRQAVFGSQGSEAQLMLEAIEAKKHIQLWEPDLSGEPMDLKVLTYNLQWWRLFGKLGGMGGVSGRLIAANNHPPFDFMGFQECEDPWRVLTDAHLLEHYSPFISKHSICMAFDKRVWKLLAHGQADVARDVPGKFSFGPRGAQWMRVQHLKRPNKTVFFLNHHGPLPLNSGGMWGGWATAHRLLGLIQKHGRKGDAIIFVGDFNANPRSKTVLEIKRHLFHVYSGSFWGGLDNVFTNIRGNVRSTANLGRGGSDHDALTATVTWGPHKLTAKEIGESVRGRGGTFYAHAAYEAADDDIALSTARTLQHCIRACNDVDTCLAWTWKTSERRAPIRCTLFSNVTNRVRHKDFYSGEPLRARGECSCQCGWATSAAICKKDDGSCCWWQCCGKFVRV